MNRRSFFAILLLSGTVTTFILSSPSVEARTADPQKYYSAMLAKLHSVKTYQATLDDRTVLQPSVSGAKPRTIKSSETIAFKAPNLFALESDSLMGAATVVSDGKREYIYSALSDEYVIQPAPKDIFSSVVGALHGKNVTWVSATVTTVNGIGATELRGSVPSDRGSATVVLYIKTDDSLPLRVVVKLPFIAGANGDGLQITRTQTFSSQKLNQPVSDSLFNFSPPNGSSRVNSLAELSAGTGEMGEQ